MITINTSKIEQVIVTPKKKSDYWNIIPAHDITTGFWIFKKTTHIDIGVSGCFTSYARSIEEFIGDESEYSIENGFVYEKAKVEILLASGRRIDRYFDTVEGADMFYYSVVSNIGKKVSYA